MKDIGNRIKENYEKPSERYLTRRVPVIVRVDGKAFHTYTRGMRKPFDSNLIYSMVNSAFSLACNMQGFKVAYIQSDEASFLMTDYDNLQTSPWFGYRQNKIESISASIMTASFNKNIRPYYKDKNDAYFDARAFNIPREEVVNYFLWRVMDWERNSVSMYCQSFFSHKQMINKSKADQHEMLHSIGKNWTTDLSNQQKNGTWIFNGGHIVADIKPNYTDIAEKLDGLIYCDKY